MTPSPRRTKKTDSSKAWQKKQGLSRSRPVLAPQQTFFIVCEGQTEKMYFESFPVKSAHIEAVDLGTTPKNIVAYAKKHGAAYDQIWCVFDMDVNPDKANQKTEFDNAVFAAKGKLHCAYSNDSFELWFVLHYKSVEMAEHRSRYNNILSDVWGIDYEEIGKTKDFARTIYAKLQTDTRANQESAIDRAKQLQNKHSEKSPHQQNPSTTVYELVVELLQWCET
jgi:RloB-like protein